MFDKEDLTFQLFSLICAVGEHFRRYAYAIRIVVGLTGTINSIQLFNEYEH